MYVVLIETSGNQRYIFATNKLREIVGASELTHRVGTQFVLEAVQTETNNRIYEADDLDGRKMRANLLNPSHNPPVGNENKAEVIMATSGKALLLVADRVTGERIIRAVTLRALQEMPGLIVHGAISEEFGEDLKEVHKAIGEVHRKLERLRYEMPSNEQRFSRLPFVAPCTTSGLPASQYYTKGPEPNPRSIVSVNKREASIEGEQRLEAVIHSVAKDVLLVSTEELEREFKGQDAVFGKGLSWVAVIHADGNGLGEIFLNFDKHTGLSDGTCTPRDYIENYRRFSVALDVCTINAAGDALENLRRRFLAEEQEREKGQESSQGRRSNKRIPVVPLILGGDDLTLLCDGQYALKFVSQFLTYFERETAEISDKPYLHEKAGDMTILEVLQNVIPQIANNAFDVPRLAICAGVAIVKPHFPFHQAYKLAEQLLGSAKQIKEKVKSKSKGEQYPCSALDYHILYDSTASRLEEIREKLKVDVNKTTWLFARPYSVSDFGDKDLSSLKDTTWLTPRRRDELEKRVAAMMAREDDNKRKFPNTQLHTLRQALFLGSSEANARLNLIRHRYQEKELEKGFDVLLCDKSEKRPSLFFAEPHEGENGLSTHFLDALDVVEFRRGEREEDGKLIDKQPTTSG